MATYLKGRTRKQLILVFKPFEHIMTIIQTRKFPPSYMVLMCTMTWGEALNLYEALLNYHNEHSFPIERLDRHDCDEDLKSELESIGYEGEY